MSVSIPVRLHKNEVKLIDKITKEMEGFVSRSEFLRFAIRHTIYETLLAREMIRRKVFTNEHMSTKKVEDEVHEIRSKILDEMRDYYGI